MHEHLDLHELPSEARVAIAEAEALIVQSRGMNVDAIVDALDACLRTRAGEIDPAVTSRLRPELRACAEAGNANNISCQQLASHLLCSLDAPAFAGLAAGTDGGPAVLVPLLADSMFARMSPRAWSLCGMLAALITVQGLPEMCSRLGRAVPRATAPAPDAVRARSSGLRREIAMGRRSGSR